jgi:hypothetical protein
MDAEVEHTTLPPHNKHTTAAEEIYQIEKIISPEERNAMGM